MEDTLKNQALKFAMKLIGLRRRSVFEIKKRLAQKGFAEDVIAETIEELNKFRYLNDEAFAESYINDRMNFRPCGRFLVKRELKQRGVADDIIERKTEELFPPEKELELAKKLAEKKMRIVGESEDKEKVRRKIKNFLEQRGFSCSTISQVMNKE